jgi:hypothetical protein
LVERPEYAVVLGLAFFGLLYTAEEIVGVDLPLTLASALLWWLWLTEGNRRPGRCPFTIAGRHSTSYRRSPVSWLDATRVKLTL